MKVLIIGGGFCGSMVAKRLDSRDELEVTLVDKNPYFEYYPSLPKLMTDPKYHSKIKKRYDEYLNNSDILTEKVLEITPRYVITNNRKLSFDILVISLGARYPIYLEDKKNVFTIRSGKEVKELSKTLTKSNNILIVGGGLIGTECAAELVTKTDKDVTVIHSKERLIERNPSMASYLAEYFLKKKGAELILNEKVTGREGHVYKTDGGRELSADLCIWSTGLSYDESIFKGFQHSIFSERGALKVNDHLQLEGHHKIFAGGDITDIDEEKTGHNADSHSRVIAENIIRLKKGHHLKRYSKMKIPLFISLGDLNGIMSSPIISIPGPLPALVKYLLEKGALLRYEFS